MYDELVKSLRVCGKALEDAVYPDWDFSLYTRAADAIEVLSKRVDESSTLQNKGGKLMGVYINMEMPKNCFECPWRCKVDPENLLCRISGEYFEETFSGTIQNRHKSCPLVPVPKHGRLIDADFIYDAVEQRYRMSSGIEHRCERDLLDLICNAPTIIPAEEG